MNEMGQGFYLIFLYHKQIWTKHLHKVHHWDIWNLQTGFAKFGHSLIVEFRVWVLWMTKVCEPKHESQTNKQNPILSYLLERNTQIIHP